MAAETDLDRVASDAAYYLIPELTKDLKERAKSAGWPVGIINNLYIDFDGSSVYVAYPDELISQIHDLEYGSEGEAPNAVIRPFVYRSSETVAEVLKNQTITALFTLENIFGE